MCAALRAASASNASTLSALKPPLNVVVVGGTAGIGRATALAIHRHCPAAHITILGRNQTAADAILAELGTNGKFLRVDASLMSEIRSVTKQIDAVDILVLSQGILTMDRVTTTENIDITFATQYYGRVLFVQELLPLLRASPHGGKVLFILNSIRGNASKILWNDMSLENTNSFYAGVNQVFSFTDLIIQYFGSQPENANVAFIHAYPGYVRTNIGDNLPAWIRIPFKCASALGFGVNPEECAEFMIHGILGTDKGYRYIDSKGETVTKTKIIDKDMANKVWEHTSQMISR